MAIEVNKALAAQYLVPADDNWECKICGGYLLDEEVKEHLEGHIEEGEIREPSEQSDIKEQERELVLKYFSYNAKKDVHTCRVCKQTFKMLGPHLFKHAQRHADVNELPKRKMDNPIERRNLSGVILQRMIESGAFGPDFSLEKFTELYDQNKSGPGAISRFSHFSRPLEKEDLALLEAYFDAEHNYSLGDLAEQFNLAGGTIQTKIPRLVLRLLHQYPTSLKEALKKQSR